MSWHENGQGPEKAPPAHPTVHQPDGAANRTWDEEERRFLFDWERMVLAARFSSTTKLVAFTLRTFANPDGTRVRPGIARLAVLCELSYASVKRARQELVRVGLLELVRRGNRRKGHTDEYRLIIADDVIERLKWLSPSEIDAAADAITEARQAAEAERLRTARSKKDQGSQATPDEDQGSHPAPDEAAAPSIPDPPVPSDQGSADDRDASIRAHTRPGSGLTDDPPPTQVTTPQQRPHPDHLPAQPPDRTYAAAARQRAADRARAVAACALCDESGYIGPQLCDHDPGAADRARRGRAAVLAALARTKPPEVIPDAS
ncbi:hypothetical protein SAMN04489727_5729 [Amycolatopsis tolypomycina]|uniref:Helix-turn-helix domain-containing protein n=1 Tax=Amycolatopsis tolypomycina TaxID=208445 RepID=A0A1H4WPA0_9PSEU|nr:hypothetical protein SAMN04489727_5729 [Amycolatopsis tolypomycina]